MASTSKQNPDELAPNVDLASMLDIDKIIDSIPAERKGLRYTEGWDPTRLDEELKQHPFFLKEIPGEGEEVPPLIQALQDLKYSPDENTPEEIALNYKEDGLFHYKLKKYRIAVLCFTEGIKSLHSVQTNNNVDLEAQLYNNRAAAQFHLQNYRSSLADCEKACNLKKGYFKATFKALECCMKLCKWNKALEYCKLCEELDSLNKDVAKLKPQILKKQKEDSSKGRKNDFEKLKTQKLINKTLTYIKNRKIKCRSDSFLNDDSVQHKVKIGSDDRLEWPVILFYPQFSQNDFIECFHEDSTFRTHLTEILENERPPWDFNDEYHVNTVGLYYINALTDGYVKASLDQSLCEILQDSRFELPSNGIPAFFILIPGNDICRNFLERLREAEDYSEDE